jgi:NAD(P)-dependent dehydrogenase (short-subunit alcohol dehydrogenase family)
VDELREKIAAENTTLDIIQLDITDDQSVDRAVADIMASAGRIDALVNNAGTFQDTDFDDLDEISYARTFDLNVKGYLFAAQAFSRTIPPDQTGANIICVGSTNSKAAEKNSVMYDASKGAILMLVRSLAVTLADKNIRVNGIGPGIIDTPLTQAGLDQPGIRENLQAQIPLHRIGLPEDIGGAAVFLASSEANYITGQMLYIDGGVTANQMSWENLS